MAEQDPATIELPPEFFAAQYDPNKYVDPVIALPTDGLVEDDR